MSVPGDEAMDNGQGRGGKRVVLWGVAAIVVLAVLLQTTRMVVRQRALAPRNFVLGRLTQAVSMIQYYERAHGTLPPLFSTSPEGDKLLSWRVHLFLFDGPNGKIEGVRVDEPWNSPANRIAAAQHLDKASFFSLQDNQPDPRTRILAVTGPNSLWDATTGLPQGELNGSRPLLMLVAVATSRYHWMEPEDIREDELLRLIDAGETIYCISTWGSEGILKKRDGSLFLDKTFTVPF